MQTHSDGQVHSRVHEILVGTLFSQVRDYVDKLSPDPSESAIVFLILGACRRGKFSLPPTPILSYFTPVGCLVSSMQVYVSPSGTFYHQMSHSPSGTFVMLPPSGRCLPSGYMLKGFFLNVEGDACRIVSFVFNPLVYQLLTFSQIVL